MPTDIRNLEPIYDSVAVGLVPMSARSAISVKAITASSAGDNPIHTPASGQRIRLGYVALSADGGNSGDVTGIVKFGAAGAPLYKVSLKAGSIYARNIGAGLRYAEGGVDTSLIVNLSTGQTVHTSIEYDEA